MIKTLSGLLLMMLLAGTIASAAVQVVAQVDDSRPIYADNTFNYRIIIVNGPKPDNIDLAPLKTFSPANPKAGTQMYNNNGQMTNYYIVTYELTAPAAGQYTLPAIEVTVDGQKYKTNEVAITVAQAGTSQQMDVETELSASTCYVGQPIELTFSFYVWTDIVQRDMMANLSFRVPALLDENFYVEESDAVAPQQRMAQLLVNGQPQLAVQDQASHNGVDCVRVRFSKILIPRQTGDFALEPASASADLAVGQAEPSRRGMLDSFFGPRYDYQRFNARSKPLSLKVLPLPSSGKPADFYGLVGNYTISASAAPVQVNVGDPITLTIRVGGSKYLKPVQWPDLTHIEGFADFKIPSERSDGQIQSAGKVFTQTIRAGSDSVKQIPPIPLTFFDAASGSYKTVHSDPIPLQVSPTRVITGADIESNTQFTSTSRQLESIKDGLSANYTSADALVDQHFHLASIVAAPAFWVLWAAPSMLLAVSLAARALTNQDPRRLAARRRKTACASALRRMHKLSPQKAGGAEVAAVLKQYIADKFAKIPGALTAEDCRRLIADSTADDALAEKLKQYTERAEAAAYSPTALDFDAAAQKELLSLLREVDKKIK